MVRMFFEREADPYMRWGFRFVILGFFALVVYGIWGFATGNFQ